MRLDDWYEKLGVPSDSSARMRLGLHAITEAAMGLGLLPLACPSVVVAGTNGKGTCVHTLSHLACRQGLRVFSFTSPHIHRLNERFRLQGVPLDDATLVRVLDGLVDRWGPYDLSFFERLTVLALAFIAEFQPDLAVMEVGLGGRLDAVNVLDATVSVLTSVGLDHQAILGETREAIGLEKIRVARPGRPFVLAEPCLPSACHDWLKAQGVPCLAVEVDRSVVLPEGLHPRAVMAGVEAYKALMAQHAVPLAPYDALLASLGDLRVPGRWQRLPGPQAVYLDVAHNVEACRALAKRLEALPRPVHVAFGVMADKDWQGMVEALAPWVDSWWPVDLPGPRALPWQNLVLHLQAQGLRVQAPCTGAELRAMAWPKGAGVGVVCGSFHTLEAYGEE